jgi:hypothetical protein
MGAGMQMSEKVISRSEYTAVTKSEFAELICVPPARVSQWLRDGTISLEALQGHGRHARVRVDLALAMLRSRSTL